MKSILLILTFLFILIKSSFCQNQIDAKTKELYLTSQSLSMNNCGIQFKIGLNDKLFLRLGLLELRVKQSNTIPPTANTFTTHVFDSKGQIQIGLEKRQSVWDNSYIFYGFDLIEQTSFSRTKIDNPAISEKMRKTDNISFETGIGIVLGYMINLKDNFYVSTEIEPEFLYLYSTSENALDKSKTKRTGIDFKLDTKVIKISIIYRWNKNASR